MPTRLWAVQDALRDVFAAAVTDPVKVYRGPRTRSANVKQYVLVGTDGGTTGVDTAADGDVAASQQFSSKGPGKWRDEAGQITCAVWVWTGSSNAAIPSADAEAIFEQCEAALYNDRTLGMGNTFLAEVAEIGIREEQTSTGPVVRVRFVVDYSALISTP